MQRVSRSVLIIIASYCVSLPFLLRPTVHGADPVGYYSWLRSAVIDGDLNVANEFDYYATHSEGFGHRDPAHVTRTGLQYNEWAAGSALLWSPFYLVAHGTVLLARQLGASIAADGYSWPYPLAAAIGSTLYALAAILLTYRICRAHVEPFVATLAALTAWYATPLVFYTFGQPLMSHATDAFACTLIVFLWWKYHDSETWRAGLLVGLAIGLATWVKTQNAAILLAPALHAGLHLVRAVRRDGDGRLLPIVRRGAATLIGFAALFAPLMLFWRYEYGTWIVNTYNPGADPTLFDWRAPHVLSVLASSNRGLFTWAPVTLVAVAGLWPLRKLAGERTFLLVVMLLAQLYVVSSWWAWDGTVAFGPRFWSNMVAVFALGLGAVIAKLRPVSKWLLAAGGSAFVVWNLLLVAQYDLGLVPRTGPVDMVAMVKNQLLVVPNNFVTLLQHMRTWR